MSSSLNRLLVVDDHPDILDFVSQVAEGVGYSVARAQSQEQFQAALTSFKPTLVMLDLQMPGADGVELIRTLARRNSRANIVLASGMDQRVLNAAEQLGKSHGLAMVGVMQKPIMLGDLECLLGRYFESRREVTAEQLDRAVDRAELRVHYQPKARLIDGVWRIDAAESLVRWEHPDYGLIYPDEFIPLAEASGVIAALTDFVLQTGIEQVAAWNRQGLAVKLAVNLSPRLVSNLEFPDQLATLAARAGVDCSQLSLEVTETAALSDPAHTLDILTRLRVKKFGLSLDDFGTGYSSVTQLYQMPFSELKIDKSLGMELQRSVEARTIVRSLVELGHNLGLAVCCEGVESAQALGFLASIGCDSAQGYYIARPMVPEAFAALVIEWNAADRGVQPGRAVAG
jgi:EAL domain-containing protein (putative c-di-GMP-specific phosphodiesterase class I)